jgi:putative DNA primase/helicase
MSDARTITHARRGRWCGHYGMIPCPVPSHGKGHGDKRPSCSIRDGEIPGRVIVKCFAGCDSRDILGALWDLGLIEHERAASVRPRQRIQPQQPREPDPDTAALALWHAAEPISGTLGERYMHGHRGISHPLPPTLRFRHDVRYPLAGTILPAVVAALQRPDRTVIAVQTTFLRLDGKKAPLSAPRITIGSLGTGAVRLAAAEETLGLAEGVENALSAMEMTGTPCWATLGAQRLPRITLPDIVRRVVIFADRDATGELHAGLAATAYTQQGRSVEIRWPPGNAPDWNDALRAECGVPA